MPRPKNPGAPEPKKRSRTGCWTCKAKKVKCGEEKPRCLNCEKNGEKVCDYSIRLNWEGRSKRKAGELTPEPQDQGPRSGGGQMQMLSFQPPVSGPPKPKNNGSPTPMIDPALSLAEFSTSPRDFSVQFPRPHKFPNSRPSSAGSQRSGTISQISSPAPMSAGPAMTSFPQGAMLPPFSTPAQVRSDAFSGLENQHKRARQSPTSQPHIGTSSPGYLSPHGTGVSLAATSDPYSNSAKQEPTSAPSNSSKINTFPLTPSNSSVASEDIYGSNQLRPSQSPLPYAYNDPRRLSVNSLLTQEAEAKASGEIPDPRTQYTTYGMDRGLPDLDMPQNDDKSVIDVVTPVLANYAFGEEDDTGDSFNEFGFGQYALGPDDSKNYTGYSDGPIPVNIPNSLHPLPQILLDNKMNLMYFHFFMEFTAKILVPHDCPDNPFKVVLPQMAVRDDDLLHLLLAYSASHRARLLGHPPPTNRIAFWVKDVFSNLGSALVSEGQVSNESVAAGIMLASLEIVAPNAFEYQVPWQKHLDMARNMIMARGGAAAVNRSRDRVSYFLIRWFAYLDVLGNFSSTGNKAGDAMFSPELYDFQEQNEFQIDCVLGFSGHLASVLARISELARKCDNERIDSAGIVDPTWQPSPEVAEEAEVIKKDLHTTRVHRFVQCPHKSRAEALQEESILEAQEIAVTNDAFFWAGLIHLSRRVLGMAADSDEVQNSVTQIVKILNKIRKGGSAEACMLFPLFSAGCEAKIEQDRHVILERVKSVEGSGMTQVHKARTLMELSWSTGKPWETLVQGEFFG